MPAIICFALFAQRINARITRQLIWRKCAQIAGGVISRQNDAKNEYTIYSNKTRAQYCKMSNKICDHRTNDEIKFYPKPYESSKNKWQPLEEAQLKKIPPAENEEKLLKKLADLLQSRENSELWKMISLIEIGRKTDFDIGATCKKAYRFYDDKCAKEFNEHSETKYKSDLITRWWDLIDPADKAPDPIWRSQLHDILLRHKNAQIVIWPHRDMDALLNMSFNCNKNYYAEITENYSELQLYAESIEKFKHNFKVDCEPKLIRNPKHDCYGGRVYFVNLPAFHMVKIFKSGYKDSKEFRELYNNFGI